MYVKNWTTLSQRIKDRDRACLLSGWKDSLSTARLVGKNDDTWVCRIRSPVKFVTPSSGCDFSAASKPYVRLPARRPVAELRSTKLIRSSVRLALLPI